MSKRIKGDWSSDSEGRRIPTTGSRVDGEWFNDDNTASIDQAAYTTDGRQASNPDSSGALGGFRPKPTKSAR